MPRHYQRVNPDERKKPGPKSQFTLEEKKQILTLYDQGARMADLAVRYVCARSTIKHIIARMRRGGKWSETPDLRP